MSTDSWIRKVAELRQLLETKDVNSSDITITDDVEIAATNMLYIQKQQQQHSNAPSQQEETKGNNNNNNTLLPSGLPPPPPTPPPSLPPTSRRTSIVDTVYNYDDTLKEVQRLVKNTLKTTQQQQQERDNNNDNSGKSLQNRSERIAEMVATAVGQAVVKTVNNFSENQSEEIKRLEAENDRLIAVIRTSSSNKNNNKSNPNNKINPQMLLGPSGLTLLSESRDNIYPLQRTFAGAIQRSLNNDVEPLCMYVLNIIQETRKLKNENVFLRKLTNQLSSESDKRFQIYNDQILFLKNVLKENGVIYASPTKKKKNATDNNNNNTNNKSNTRMNTKDEISSFTKVNTSPKKQQAVVAATKTTKTTNEKTRPRNHKESAPTFLLGATLIHQSTGIYGPSRRFPTTTSGLRSFRTDRPFGC